MKFTIVKAVMSVAIAFLCAACTTPALDIIPISNPMPIMKESAPAWLPKGKRDDGYVSVRTEVVSNDAPCKTIGSAGSPFLNLYEQKIQIVASMQTSGFKTSLDGLKIPIATFDGRSNPGGCVGLNTLSSRVISFARLAGSEADSEVKIIVAIDSTTDVSSNLIPAAQTALGVVSVFTTGGATSTVAGITSWIATPALAKVQERYDIDLNKVLKTQSVPTINGWSDIRKGIDRIEIPVYMVPTGKSSPKITSADAGKFPYIFKIVLNFEYTKTLFDLSVAGQDDFPSKDSIERQAVLNYPNKMGVPSFMQMIYGEDSNLFKAASVTNKQGSLELSCPKLNGILTNLGLSKIDRAVVVKSFLDEANDGPGWYVPANANKCFGEMRELGDTVAMIYGAPVAIPEPKGAFVVGDIVQLSGADIESWKKVDPSIVVSEADYKRWKTVVPPLLSEFRQALKVKGSRIESLLTTNGGRDIDSDFFGFGESMKPVADSAQIGSTKNTFPGIAKLAERRIDKAGCFTYGKTEDFNPQSYAAHMLLLDENKELWHLMLNLAAPDDKVSGRFKSYGIYSMENAPDWREHFRRYKFSGGECDEILPLLKPSV